MADFSPAVRIATFASDNKMSAPDVKRRRDHVRETLSSGHLEMVAYGSNGDTREMNCILEKFGCGNDSQGTIKDDK